MSLNKIVLSWNTNERLHLSLQKNWDGAPVDHEMKTPGRHKKHSQGSTMGFTNYLEMEDNMIDDCRRKITRMRMLLLLDSL
jgi:hypothetical protein